MTFPHWRKMTWVIVVWCVVMAIWIVGAIIGAASGEECGREAQRALGQETCVAARDAGTGIAVVALWFVWFFGFIILSLIWFMSRPKGRNCPACGMNVKQGRSTCSHCQFDLAVAAGQGTPT